MTWLFASDLHLSDRPKDRYRFGLFKWLAEQQQKHQITATFILGDITDRKDNHSAVLVNKTVNSLLTLKPPVYILKGNHDFWMLARKKSRTDFYKRKSILVREVDKV